MELYDMVENAERKLAFYKTLVCDFEGIVNDLKEVSVAYKDLKRELVERETAEWKRRALEAEDRLKDEK